jgi:hypothetical protein
MPTQYSRADAHGRVKITLYRSRGAGRKRATDIYFPEAILCK